MKIHALLRTAEYRGDHSADVGIAFDVDPNETVAELVRRINLSQHGNAFAENHTEWIELRQVRG